MTENPQAPSEATSGDGPAKTDVAIIGAGPTGLFCVFECGMLGLRCHVVEALEEVGGQCAALYPEKPIYDIPGHPHIDAQDLVDRLVEQAAPFAPVYHLGHQVTELRRLDEGSDGAPGGWRLVTDRGVTIEASAVIVAAGVGAFGPKRPPLDGLHDFENQPPGHGVKYLVKRREDFRDRKVVIAGGGDSAADWAISLAEVATHVSIVHRRAKFRAAPESVSRMEALAEAGRLDIVTPFQLARLEGEGGELTAVVVADLDGNERRIEADVLLPFYGVSAHLGPIEDWGFEVDHKHIKVDPGTMAPLPADGGARPGLFVVGDIATYPGKLKLILTGFAEAAIAAHGAHGAARPDEELHFEYSTTKGPPGQ